MKLIDIAHATGLSGIAGELAEVGEKAGTSQAGSLDIVAGNVVGTALSLVGLFFLVLTVYAGYMYMAARGDDAKIEKALAIVRGAVVGLFIVILAYAVTFLLGTRLNRGAQSTETSADLIGCCIEINTQGQSTYTEATLSECTVIAQSSESDPLSDYVEFSEQACPAQ